MPSEREEVVLRIKAAHFQFDRSLQRLRDQVANFEAIQTHTDRVHSRKPIPDDVRLLVWTRDGGACVKCGSKSGLHFDHVIPLAKGGSEVDAQNLQILCSTCNLSKSDHII